MLSLSLRSSIELGNNKKRPFDLFIEVSFDPHLITAYYLFIHRLQPQAYVLSQKYGLSSSTIYQGEMKSLFPIDMENYGALNNYEWSNFDILSAVQAFSQYYPPGVPSAMYLAALSRDWKSKVRGGAGANPELVAKVEGFCLSLEQWMTSVSVRDWLSEGALRKAEKHPSCNARCKTFAGTMEAFYLSNNRDIFIEKPLDVLPSKKHLCPPCLDKYSGWQYQLELTLWNLLAVWATGKSWDAIPKNVV